MRTFRVLGLSVLLAAQAGAQAPPPATRDGFWFRFGAGAGSATFRCDSCKIVDEAKGAGLTVQMAVGRTVSPKVLVGGEFNGWFKKLGDIDFRAGTLSATAYYYPAAARGYFVKGGVGYAFYRAAQGSDAYTSRGIGLVVGAGYNIRLWPEINLSVTPQVSASVGSLGGLNLNGAAYAEGFRQAVVELGLGLAFH